MRKYDLSAMVGGWFVGDFDPAAMRSKEFEVAVKKYRAGDKEGRHVHRVATEITLILSGRAQMNGVIHEAESIVLLEPGDETDFEALTDVTTVVVKAPSVIGDKYEC